MNHAISRYGARVIPNTMQLVAELEKKGTLLEGPHVAAFESAFASRLGEGVHATATSYGRMAFYYLLKAYAFPAGSEVVFPALTFWVMPEMARVAGLTPVFADVDPMSFNMTADSLARVITRRTVAVVPTHLWGLPCDMRELVSTAREHRLRVIEDCAHALGARYRGRPVGALGDASIFSFQMLKPLNAYGGGMAVTRNPVVAARVAALAAAEPLPDRAHVKQRLWHGRVQRIATRPEIFTWSMFPLIYTLTRLRLSLDMYFWEKIRALEPLPSDYRVRMSNVQAAIALEGLRYLDEWTARTQHNAARMSALLRDVRGIQVPTSPPDRTHAYYQYCAYVPDRDAVVEACLKRAVDIETLHVDVCTEVDRFGPPRLPTPGARQTTQTIQIPVYESLSDGSLERVATVVREVVQALGARAPAAVHQS
jgi:dTDP-4-amino-4,6-dideoxygalactose transaminase